MKKRSMTLLTALFCLTLHTVTAAAAVESGAYVPLNAAAEYLKDTVIQSHYEEITDDIYVELDHFEPVYDEECPSVRLEFSVYNESERDVRFESEGLYINDFIFGDQITKENRFLIVTGTYTTFTFKVRLKHLTDSNVEQIGWIDLFASIYDVETGNELVRNYPVHAETSRYGQFEQSFQYSGQTIFDDHGIRVILGDRMLETDDGLGAFKFIDNQSGQDITVSVILKKVNGIDFDSYGPHYIKPGKKIYCAINIPREQLALHNIDKVETVSLVVNIKDSSNHTLFDTGEMTVSFQ